ncbi:MAG: YceD family protein [Corticimicrobacter sp.]|uniref:YceD family protein n=1 Tax=Corticimicrobacter sp. TaxID=2678536 RepID=UPI0032DA147D
MNLLEWRRLSYSTEGRLPLARFSRLLDGLPEQLSQAGVSWSARCVRGVRGEPRFELEVKADPQVECQRCLEPFPWSIDVHATFDLVDSEAELNADAPGGEEEDGMLEEPERLLCSSRFDLLGLIEDELVLAVPYVPRHAQCELPVEVEPAPELPERPSPFAALAALKDKKQ